MVVGSQSSARSAWQAVTAKVVLANRLRKGLGGGKDLRIEAFKVEELGGRAGQSVFGPVSTFNGQVTFRVKKPLKGVTVTIVFHGVTGMEGQVVNFISTSRDIFSGDLLSEGWRSFLFAFQFPHVNLPPTSERPLISYIFSARLTAENRPDTADDSILPFGQAVDPARFLTKPLRIPFMPYVDPSLETPLVSRKPSMRKKRSSEKNGVKRPDNRSAHTLYPPGSPGPPTADAGAGTAGANSGNGSPRVRGPKLTLTTADLPLSASSNSTPVIDKPHPSALSSAITRSTRITDDDNNTIAKLTIEMPSSRFLPGDEIVMKLTLQVREGLPLPKGLAARVVETRALAGESPDGEALEKEQVDDRDEPPLRIKVCGKERLRVLTGKKLVLHHGEVQPVQPPDSPDTGLAGGCELVEMMTVMLPPFQTFIADSLLPTATLPLGDPANDADVPESPAPTASSPKHAALNGKGKAVDNAGVLAARTRALYFRVQHLVQITIPMGGGHHWYQAHNHHHHRSQQHNRALEDLEVTVPIILGNRNPKAARRPPEVRLVAPDADRGGAWRRGGGPNEGSSSYSSSRSNSGSGGSGLAAAAAPAREWREGMKFLTLREAEVRPQFVMDL